MNLHAALNLHSRRNHRAIALVTLWLLASAIAAILGEPMTGRAQTLEATPTAPVAMRDPLYVQHAAMGTFTPIPDGRGGTYFLTLMDVFPETVYVSSHPDHQTSAIGTDAFVATDVVFGTASPPVAAVVFADPIGDGRGAAIAELRDPLLVSRVDTIRYRVTVVTDEVPSSLSQWASRSDNDVPAVFGAVALFIAVDHGHATLDVAVTDMAGQPIPDALVMLACHACAVAMFFAAITDMAGTATFANLPLGPRPDAVAQYGLHVTAAGYAERAVLVYLLPDDESRHITVMLSATEDAPLISVGTSSDGQ